MFSHGARQFGSVVGGLLMCTTGCTLSATATATVPTPTVQVSTTAPPAPGVTVQAEPQLVDGVTVIETNCIQGADEQCNGLDDNCNGQIDEGCGYSSGDIQITLAWNSGADIDLYVTDPFGETVSYSHTNANSGGHLDQDARGNCRPEQSNNRIENVYWNASMPPSGQYRAELHYWGECNSGAGPTNTTLSISVGGQVIGAYQYVLNPQQRVQVASFNIP